MMKLRDEQRGFVLSGIALLLVLPAMLLAASCLRIVEAGGEAASLQTLSDKVSYTGHDIERMIGYMSRNRLPINDDTLRELAENYRAATGLLVDIGPVTVHPLWIHVQNTGVDHYAGTKYCRVTNVAPGVWRYSFEDLDEELGETPDWDFNEPRLLVEKLDGKLRITVEEYDGGYHSDVYYSSQLLWMGVGGSERAHIGENTEVDENVQIGVPIYVRDPRGAARYTENVSLT